MCIRDRCMTYIIYSCFHKYCKCWYKSCFYACGCHHYYPMQWYIYRVSAVILQHNDALQSAFTVGVAKPHCVAKSQFSLYISRPCMTLILSIHTPNLTWCQRLLAINKNSAIIFLLYFYRMLESQRCEKSSFWVWLKNS